MIGQILMVFWSTMLFNLLNADGRVCPKDAVAFDSHPILEIPPTPKPPLD